MRCPQYKNGHQLLSEQPHSLLINQHLVITLQHLVFITLPCLVHEHLSLAFRHLQPVLIPFHLVFTLLHLVLQLQPNKWTGQPANAACLND